LGQVRRPVNAIIGKTRAPPIITTHFNWPELQPTATNCQPSQVKKSQNRAFSLATTPSGRGRHDALKCFIVRSNPPAFSGRQGCSMLDVSPISAFQYVSISAFSFVFQHFSISGLCFSDFSVSAFQYFSF
jgi:hypothetical protein